MAGGYLAQTISDHSPVAMERRWRGDVRDLGRSRDDLGVTVVTHLAGNVILQNGDGNVGDGGEETTTTSHPLNRNLNHLASSPTLAYVGRLAD